jgi:hypothetical protein
MAELRSPDQPDLIEPIPDPDTVRSWLADSIRRSELLRSLRCVAIRKAAFERTTPARQKEVSLAS